MSRAALTQDCVLRRTVHIKLTARAPVMEGDRDKALDVTSEVGGGLVVEAMRVLQAAADREGFDVDIRIEGGAY